MRFIPFGQFGRLPADDGSLAVADGLTLLSLFDTPEVIAGEGTVAIEMLEDVPDLDTLVVPVGGGGLLSGMAVVACTSWSN